MDECNGPSIGLIPPDTSAGQNKSTKTDEYGFVWASATGQPSHSHWYPGSAIHRSQSSQLSKIFQWVAVEVGLIITFHKS